MGRELWKYKQEEEELSLQENEGYYFLMKKKSKSPTFTLTHIPQKDLLRLADAIQVEDLQEQLSRIENSRKSFLDW